jgi:hypothetical protein
MFVAAAPRQGQVLVGRDAPGRALRVSAHPESGRIVLSIWQDTRCIGTVRLKPEDVPDVLHALGDALVACDGESAADPGHPIAS